MVANDSSGEHFELFKEEYYEPIMLITTCWELMPSTKDDTDLWLKGSTCRVQGSSVGRDQVLS